MLTIPIEQLKLTNYVRAARASTNYWVDFSRAKLNDYFERFGENFKIIIHSEINPGNEYYVIPFSILQDLFIDAYLANDSLRTDSNRRWVVNIKHHILKVTNCHSTVDVKDYYGNPYLAYPLTSDTDEDYSAENKLQECYVRIKQSKFRRDVFGNFNSTCCISGVTEGDLLVASHIIPWSHNSETRLDPTNGLCLFILYDKLFDKGYFTLNDDFSIRTITNFDNLSDEIVKVLASIDNKPIQLPNASIKQNYLKYHRENIFIER